MVSGFLHRKMDRTVRNGPRMAVFKEWTPPIINGKMEATKEETVRRKLGSSMDWRSKLEKFNNDFAKWFWIS
jgi:hypothetical protein